MAATTYKDGESYANAILQPPPPNAPHSLPIPNSASEGRSPVYRHWRFRDIPLMKTLDPKVRTAHDMFEHTVKKRPNMRCLGRRPWDPATKTWGKYEWMTYAEVAERRKNFGIGIRELNKQAGQTEDKFGVGLYVGYFHYRKHNADNGLLDGVRTDRNGRLLVSLSHRCSGNPSD